MAYFSGEFFCPKFFYLRGLMEMGDQFRLFALLRHEDGPLRSLLSLALWDECLVNDFDQLFLT
jgi:hypothetical protein